MNKKEYKKTELTVQVCLPPGLEVRGASKWTTSIKIMRTGYHIMKIKEWLEAKQWKAPVDPNPAGWKPSEKTLSRYAEKEINPGYYGTINVGS